MTSSTVKLLMAAGIAGAAMPQNLSAKEIILEGRRQCGGGGQHLQQ